jgi:hypothetical protein
LKNRTNFRPDFDRDVLPIAHTRRIPRHDSQSRWAC